MRLGFALALGYPTWTAMPAPVKEAVKNGVRLALFCERLFTPFWAGGEVPQRFFTASENLRRQLSDLGLEPRAPSVDIVAMLAQMRVQEETASIKPAR